MTETEHRPARPPRERRRSWLVNPDARALTSGDDILVRRGGLVTRCSGAGIGPFLTALLGNADEGLITVDPGEVDPRRLAHFERLMAQLVTAGLLVELDEPGEAEAETDGSGGGRPDPVVMGLWQRGAAAVTRAEIADRLRTRPVRIEGAGPLADRLGAALGEAGLTLTHTDDAVATVVLGAHEQDPLLVDWNTRSLAKVPGDDTGEPARPWLAVTPFEGSHAVVGPWVVPGESACYTCYLLRRAATFPDRDVSPSLPYATATGPLLDSSPRSPGLRLVQTGIVVERLVEYVGLADRSGQAVPGGLTTVAAKPDGIEVEHHRVLRVPRCASCSPATGRGYPQVWYARAGEEEDAS